MEWWLSIHCLTKTAYGVNTALPHHGLALKEVKLKVCSRFQLPAAWAQQDARILPGLHRDLFTLLGGGEVEAASDNGFGEQFEAFQAGERLPPCSSP